MRFTAYTAAAVLAFTLTGAGAVPSPQADDSAVSHSDGAHTESPFYYTEEADDAEVEKRDPGATVAINHGNGHGNGHGGGGHHTNWKAANVHGRGPAAEEDDYDVTEYLNHPDPVVASMATKVQLVARGRNTMVNGISQLNEPVVHWWEQESDKNQHIIKGIGGNPNIEPIMNTREQAGGHRFPDAFKRDIKQDHPNMPSGDILKGMGGPGPRVGGVNHTGHGHGGPPHGDGSNNHHPGGGQDGHQGGPPGGMGQGQGQNGHQGGPPSGH